ncbi:MAG TPA: flagellin lysine-N-methylase [Patescibacteria group bacterium]|nr:flagellin lysine-N-methylase [Patescibacteria group bacterium]
MYIYLDIVRDFNCAMCGACCRNDWMVTLDEESYRRNQEFFAARDDREEFEAAFTRLTGKMQPGEYAVINKKGGACWFLSPDQSCWLHRQAGHEHLDSVCQTFPRYPMDTARGLELSLSFSCPEVLRLVARVQPLEIMRSETPPLAVREDVPTVAVYPEQRPIGHSLRHYFELEHHFIDILQWRGVPIAERLLLLQKTAAGLDSAEPGDMEAARQRLNQTFQNNYMYMDMQTVPPGTPACFTAEILQEHFLVNLIFRKIFYLYGLTEAARLLVSFGQRLGDAARPFAAEAAVEAVRRMILELELAFGHNRQALTRVCRVG